MITTLILSTLLMFQDPVDFGAFNKFHNNTQNPSYKKFILVDKYFYLTDKFGQTWKYTDQNILNDFIKNQNLKPFIAVDKFGQAWQHQNKEILDSFIQQRNLQNWIITTTATY